jgi:hypothetical protein
MNKTLRLLCLVGSLFALGCGAAGSGPVHEFDLSLLAGTCPSCNWEPSSTGGKPVLVLHGSLESGVVLGGLEQGVAWDDARWLVADVEHGEAYSAILVVEFFQRSRPDVPRIRSKMGILPGLPTRVVLPLEYLDGQSFFMARQPRRLKGVMPGRRLVASEVASVRLRLEPVAEGFQPRLRIPSLWLSRSEPLPLPPFQPVVDSLGQWNARDWPGKTRDESDLQASLRALSSQATTAAFPEDWSRFGGWKGLRFPASGYFRTHHDGRRWWLVDPEGYAFFSLGVDVVVPSASGPVEGMEDLHTWLPPGTGEFEPAWSTERGLRSFSFLTANWIRVFGADWRARWEETTRSLLTRWCFNTVANWSDLEFARRSRLPYVVPLSGFPTTGIKLYRDFPDVFAAEYETAAADFARQIKAFQGDAFLIGYFLDNEPLWAFGDNIVASEMLATTQQSASRRKLVEWLQERYQGDVDGLNAAWGTSFSDFGELERRAVADAHALSAQAEADLREFSGLLVDRYIALPSAALKALDPDHLNLGIRYASISSDLCYRAGSQFDVFSINAYRMRPEPEVVEEIVRRTGKPVIIGEFHHGAVDRGLPSTGIRGVASQEERGVAYRYYVEQGAALPGLVGIHYFQLNDQPVLGRFDGENYNIGLVDICNRPYREITEAATETNRRIYEVVSGRAVPVSREALRIPDIYF